MQTGCADFRMHTQTRTARKVAAVECRDCSREVDRHIHKGIEDHRGRTECEDLNGMDPSRDRIDYMQVGVSMILARSACTRGRTGRNYEMMTWLYCHRLPLSLRFVRAR